MPEHNSPGPLTTISRHAHRGVYDPETIYAILDEAIEVTIAYAAYGTAMAIPTGFVRMDDKVYIHASVKSHFIQQLLRQEKVCLTVSLLDGMVLANTAFNHSFNYRSVVAFSKPFEVEDPDQKMEILKAFTDKLLPGRWEDDIKKPTPEELKITAVLGFSLEEASAKIRQGAAGNNQQEAYRKVWTGYIPLKRNWGAPVKNADTDPLVEEPAYLAGLYAEQTQS
ncbi:pyridoxamine 5'-phosphate oxidase family protein [Cesiribacter sp. SM1]|uniref:pyridoxamine 5'-phosphate oxidase family protein n=1 Tax=Cesiribacter sp. SM1 TaxID=2861196 RepID=UPI001CD41B1C|nr:pyridoxamine 5'-phosphate oxidase family protein [Cesiribacter sp. SM1]